MLSTESGSSPISSFNVQAITSGGCSEEPEEPEDILSAFLGVLYNYTAITHADSGTIFSYTYPGPSLRVNGNAAPSEEDTDSRWTSDSIKLTLHTPNTQARNWALHASSIWAAAVFLADHIAELDLGRFMYISEARRDCADPDLRFEALELGAGAGLPGLLVAKCLERIEESGRTSGSGVKNWGVTLSDYPDDLLIETLRENVRRNGFGDENCLADLSPGQDRIFIIPYAWGEDSSALRSSRDSNAGLKGFDLIIASDTLWNAALHNAFARTLYLLLRRTSNARVHLVAGLHTGRCVLSEFFHTVRSVHRLGDYGTKAENDGPTARLEVLEISEREVSCDGKREWREERGGEDEAERRRWVVWIVLGWVGL